MSKERKDFAALLRSAFKPNEVRMITQAGLHQEDFDWAVKNTGKGMVLTKFQLSSDMYHWEAVYEDAAALSKKNLEG